MHPDRHAPAIFEEVNFESFMCGQEVNMSLIFCGCMARARSLEGQFYTQIFGSPVDTLHLAPSDGKLHLVGSAGQRQFQALGCRCPMSSMDDQLMIMISICVRHDQHMQYVVTRVTSEEIHNSHTQQVWWRFQL